MPKDKEHLFPNELLAIYEQTKLKIEPSKNRQKTIPLKEFIRQH